MEKTYEDHRIGKGENGLLAPLFPYPEFETLLLYEKQMFDRFEAMSYF